MANQSALVVLRRQPYDGPRNEEALRIAVGLTIAITEITVLLLDDAAPLALALRRGDSAGGVLDRHWQALAELGVTRLVERESLRERDLDESALEASVGLVHRAEAAAMLLRHEAVMVF